MKRAIAKVALEDEIRRYDWFHTIDFGEGVVAKGHCTAEILKAKADCYFNAPLAGKTVLDIGCWDGYFSLEALWRGASKVVSTDHYVWNTQWSRGSFELVRKRLAPQMEAREIEVYDISPDTVGTFDLVLFAGVLYHLRHPLLGLEKAASVCRDLLIIETVFDALSIKQPAMVFYPGGELKGDPSNWWGPNRLLVEAMLRNLGFKHITFTPTPIPRKWTLFDYVKRNPAITPRGVFHARRH